MNLARHYRTLGLRPGSSGRELKAAYRQLVRRYHPDINPDKQAVERFIKINDAYTAISEATQNRARRARTNSAQTTHKSTNKSTNQPSEPKHSSPSTPSPHQPAQPKHHTDQATAKEPAAAQPEKAVEPLNLDNLSVENLKLQLEKLGIGKFSPSHVTGTDIASDDTATHSKPSTDEQENKLKQEAYLQLKALLQQQKYPRAIALVEGLAHRMPRDNEISQWQAIVYQRWGRMLIGQGQTQKARIYLKKALRTDPNNPSLWSEVNRDFWQLAHLGNPLDPLDQPANSAR